MLNSDLKVINNDVKTLVKDAQALFRAAAALTEDKAEEVRDRGMRLLDSAVDKVQETYASGMAVRSEIAETATEYVKDNPWRMVAAMAGVGLLVGVALGHGKSANR